MELYEDLCQREEADGRKSVWGTGGDRGALQKDYGIPSERKKKRCGCLVEAGAGECGQPAVERSCRQGQRIRFLARMPKLNIHGLLWCF